MCVHTCMRERAYVAVLTCVGTHREQRLMSGVYITLHLLFWRQGLSENLELTVLSRLDTSKPQELSGLHNSKDGVTGAHCHT